MGGSSVAGCWAGNLAASGGTRGERGQAGRAGEGAQGLCWRPGDAHGWLSSAGTQTHTLERVLVVSPMDGGLGGGVAEQIWAGHRCGTRAGLSVGTLGTVRGHYLPWGACGSPGVGCAPRCRAQEGREPLPPAAGQGQRHGRARRWAGGSEPRVPRGREGGAGRVRPSPPATCAAAAACRGWRGGGGGGRRGKDGGRSTPVMLHARSSSPPESPTWRAPSSPSAVPGCRRGGCSEGLRPRAALSPGPPPAAGGRPAGPEPPGPGRRGSAEA